MKKGFTLIEVVFLAVVLGILASVAIPHFSGTKHKAVEKSRSY